MEANKYNPVKTIICIILTEPTLFTSSMLFSWFRIAELKTLYHREALGNFILLVCKASLSLTQCHFPNLCLFT